MNFREILIENIRYELGNVDFENSDAVEESYNFFLDAFGNHWAFMNVNDESVSLRDGVFIVCTLDDYKKYTNKRDAYVKILNYLEENNDNN